MPSLKGADGVSDVPGPRGEPGPKPTPQDIRDVVTLMPELRGPAGESIVGPQGERGERGPVGPVGGRALPVGTVSDETFTAFRTRLTEHLESLQASFEELAQRVNTLEQNEEE